jgi:periplasmic iron binding protein
LTNRGFEVLERWAGRLVVLLILGGVIAILALNLNLKGRNQIGSPSGKSEPPPVEPAPQQARAPTGVARIREYPIGDEVEVNQMVINAVWLPPVQMEGMIDSASSALIHLEADIHATQGNRNGFAEHEFIPYLVVRYTITPRDGKTHGEASKPIEGKLMPMVARDGLHYGATIEMPRAGSYKLTYAIDPPSAGGLGRHVDPATGVDPWWKPCQVSFDWDYPGPPRASSSAVN